MIAIIDYNAGNTRSVINAIERLGFHPVLTADPEKILQADKVILPGVGHASSAMEELDKRNLIGVVRQVQKPFLGVCLGMQIMLEHSEEGDTPCLGLLPGSVLKFESKSEKIPHMGWNTVTHTDEGMWKGMDAGGYFYFVHSYFVPKSEFTTAATDDILPFSAGIKKDNFNGVQFHPEKSATIGEQLLMNFLKENK